ncbi:MAG: BatD family protein [Legionellaceae bacterium]|nr:BatD family protein [Legionellaceae bacterium]
MMRRLFSLYWIIKFLNLTNEKTDAPRLDRGVHGYTEIAGSRGQTAGSRHFGNSRTKNLIIQLFLLFSCCWNIAIAAVAIEISPATITIADLVRVTLTLDADNRTLPDLTPLSQDFNIIGTERHVSYTMINGQARSINQWSIVLKPKRIGVLPIPAIQIGQEHSLPSQVTVTPGSTQSSNNPDNTDSADKSLLIAEVDQTKPFINQQVIYTVKLLNRQHLVDAQYQPPHIEDALLIPLGDGRHYQTVMNKQIYEVEEQQYAIFPQKKGHVSISPPSFNALVYDDFSPKRVELRAKSISLAVEPLPPNQTYQNWLPAKKVRLTESYGNSATTFLEGDTIVRTITLEAQGLIAQLLPSLAFTNSEQYNVYPDKPSIQNNLKQNELWGSSNLTVTYVLSKAGKVTLPAIQVPWYNSETKQYEIATTPEHTITVNAKAGSVSTKKITTTKEPKTAVKIKNSTISAKNYFSLIWMAIIGVLFFVIVWLWKKFTLKSKKHPAKPHPLRAACKMNDPQRARAALMDWAKTCWPNKTILNLSDIPVSNLEFQKELALLSSVLYARNNVEWTGNKLWESFCALKSKRKTTNKKRKQDLPPINPKQRS